MLPGGAEIGRPVGSYLFDPRGTVVARGDRTVYGAGDAALHVHDPAGRLRRIIRQELRWHAGDRALEPREAERWIDSAVARVPDEARRPQLRRCLELLPRADPLPAHDRAVLDTTGRLRVSRWSPWDDQRGTDWAVFDAEGRLIATAEMPAGRRILEIGEEWVIGRVEDEVGVESITTALNVNFRGRTKLISEIVFKKSIPETVLQHAIFKQLVGAAVKHDRWRT